MILIDDILIDEAILSSEFCCDLGTCKGACCTFPGEQGAPLVESEVQKMIDAVEPSAKYLSKRSLDYIGKYGVYQGEKGNRTTMCINGRDCVFVYWEGDIAKCAIERAYFAKEYEFRKPISCHLFPIRESFFSGKYLYYQKIDECSSGVRFGTRNKISLLTTLSEALERAYGKDWIDLLKAYDKGE